MPNSAIFSLHENIASQLGFGVMASSLGMLQTLSVATSLLVLVPSSYNVACACPIFIASACPIFIASACPIFIASACPIFIASTECKIGLLHTWLLRAGMVTFDSHAMDHVVHSPGLLSLFFVSAPKCRDTVLDA